MTIKSNILIIGSTGRNTGKTEFACRVIEKQSVRNQIIGVKVIPVDKSAENCHRGLEGCGLCNSLTGDYEIIEEKGADSSKDTARMLKAGAAKVYLLIADRIFLEKGIGAILSMLPEKQPVVIESNSIRRVLKPGLFVVIKKPKGDSVKRSCAEVIDFADKVIEFDRMGWDFDPDKVVVQNDCWIMME